MDQNDGLSKVEFEKTEWQQSNRSFNTDASKMIQWVIKYSGGGLKDEKQASYTLIGFVVVMIGVSLFLIFSGGDESGAKIEAPPGQKVIYPENWPPLLQKGFQP